MNAYHGTWVEPFQYYNSSISSVVFDFSFFTWGSSNTIIVRLVEQATGSFKEFSLFQYYNSSISRSFTEPYAAKGTVFQYYNSSISRIFF